MKIRLLWLVVLALLIAVTPVLAASPHFVSVSGSVNGSGALVVKFKEAGLGGGQTINYTLTANATGHWGCLNPGGNHPRAANKHTVTGPVNGSGSFAAAKNGNINGSITASAPPMDPGFTCPGKMTIVLGKVTYTDIVLKDTTTPVVRSITNVSREFYSFK